MAKFGKFLAYGAAVVALPAAAAAAQPRTINIPSEEAAKSIPEFARQENVQIIAPVGQLRGVKTPAVSGSMEIGAALNTLLGGTGLEVANNDGDTIILRRSVVTQADRSDVGGAPPPSPPSSAASVESVTVTGSRIRTNGNDLPTPVTVVSIQQLLATTPSNIPDGLNKLPTFAGAQNSNSAPNGSNGKGSRPTGNFLDMRGLGPIRTLVLEDGHRVPSTFFDGTVDTNMLPQMLIQRVEVVTGGASAVYGSDAVSGVVNFIIDKKFTGLKALVQGGISTYGDAKSFRVGVAGGEDVFDRGHVIWSLEYYDRDSIPDQGARDYGNLGANVVGSGTKASPYTLITNARRSNLAFGGLVTSGPFSGKQFAPDGTLEPFNVGTPTVTGNISTGGDGAIGRGLTILPVLNNGQAFGRFDYDFNDDMTGFVQVGYALSRSYSANQAIPLYGTAYPLTIYSGNAYLTSSEQSALDAAHASSFGLSLFNVDINRRLGLTYQTGALSLTAGLQGTLFGTYNWDAYYTHGDTRTQETTTNNLNGMRLYAAIDAVKDGAGNTVCRVTLTAPGAYPGCVPLDLMGTGGPTKAGLNYISGETSWVANNTLDDFATNLTGTVFDNWAGPVKVALGAEYRIMNLDVTTSVPDNTFYPANLRAGPDGKTFLAKNLAWVKEVQSAGGGEEDVYEGDAEIDVPLLKDLPLIQLLSFNGAYRYTDYSISGSSNTWKLGLDWQVFDDLRLRATRSRDFRAPTLWDLFQQQSISSSGFNDILTHTATSANTVSGGNPNLKPEVARNTTAGAVYTPGWLPGFSFSADYFHVAIDNAIGAVSGSDASVQNICIQSGGTSPLCSLIVRPYPITNTTPANIPTLLYALNQNIAKIYTEGVDFEANYAMDLSETSLGGALNLRALWTHQPTLKSQTIPGAVLTNAAGTAQAPSDRATFTADYRVGDFAIDVLERYQSSFHQALDPTLVYAIPNVRAYFQTDVGLSYDFVTEDVPFTGFLNVSNLFDTQGGLYLPPGSSIGGSYPIAPGADLVGRYFTIGLRARM